VRKVIFLISLLLLITIGCYVFITMHLLRNSYKENSQKAFLRTEQVIDSQLQSLEDNMKKQAELIGMMPVLRATIEAGDIETIKDSVTSYQTNFKYPIFDLVRDDMKLLVSVNDTYDAASEQTKNLVKKALKAETNSAVIVIKNKLSLIAAAPVGIPEPMSALLIGVILDKIFTDRIKNLTNVDLTIVSNQNVLASSLPASSLSQFSAYLLKMNNQAKSEVIESSELDSLMMFKELKDLDGKTLGYFVLQQSLAELKQTELSIYKNVLLITIIILTLSLFGTIYVSGSLSKPIIQLKVMMETIIKTKDLQTRALIGGQDEIASLAKSFNHLLEQIEKRQRALEDYNLNLETRVAERTTEVLNAKKKIEQVLNTIDQGLFTFKRNGNIEGPCSNACEFLFARKIENFHIGHVIGTNTEDLNDLIDMVFNETTNIDSLLELFPEKIICGEKSLKLEYKVTRENEKISSILCVVTDRTLVEYLESKNTSEAKKNAALISVISNKKDFLEVVEITQNLNLDSNDKAELARQLHTMKGFYSTLNCRWLVDICQHWEDQLNVETSDFKSVFNQAFRQLRTELVKFIDENNTIIKLNTDQHVLQISYNSILEAFNNIPQKPTHQDVSKILDNLMRVPVSEELSWLNDAFVNTALNLNKIVSPIIFDETAKVPTKIYRDLFRTFVHIARNTADHGIEENSYRQDIGKKELGNLALKVLESPTEYEFHFTDNGAGINIEALKNSLRKHGRTVPQSEQEIIDMIFESGITSKTVATETSGRGVGLDAIRNEARKLNGDCFAKNIPGVGLTIIVKFQKIQYSDSLKYGVMAA